MRRIEPYLPTDVRGKKRVDERHVWVDHRHRRFGHLVAVVRLRDDPFRAVTPVSSFSRAAIALSERRCRCNSAIASRRSSAACKALRH